MKQPIDVDDIREGMKIRWEGESKTGHTATAIEYFARNTGDEWTEAGGQYYRIEPHKPAILYPAGTHLWLTRDFLPWTKGQEIVLAEDLLDCPGRSASVHTDLPYRVGIVANAVNTFPPVKLPATPTFGLLEWTTGPNTRKPDTQIKQYGRWYAAPCMSGNVSGYRSLQVHAEGSGLQIPARAVTKFTPATAVPTAALERLREAQERALDIAPNQPELKNDIRRDAMSDFCCDVDRTNA